MHKKTPPQQTSTITEITAAAKAIFTKKQKEDDFPHKIKYNDPDLQGTILENLNLNFYLLANNEVRIGVHKQQVLGKGAYGTVKAISTTTNQKTIFKKIPQELFNPAEVTALQKTGDLEGNITCQGKDNKFYNYIFAKHHSGTTLTKYNTNHIETKNKIALAIATIEALQKIHAQQIIHNDIKGDNVLFFQTDQGYTVNFIDFGLSNILNHNNKTVSSHLPVGTPNYAAIESMYAFSYEKPSQPNTFSCSEKSDIFALGKTFIHDLQLTHSIIYAMQAVDYNERPSLQDVAAQLKQYLNNYERIKQTDKDVELLLRNQQFLAAAMLATQYSIDNYNTITQNADISITSLLENFATINLDRDSQKNKYSVLQDMLKIIEPIYQADASHRINSMGLIGLPIRNSIAAKHLIAALINQDVILVKLLITNLQQQQKSGKLPDTFLRRILSLPQVCSFIAKSNDKALYQLCLDSNVSIESLLYGCVNSNNQNLIEELYNNNSAQQSELLQTTLSYACALANNELIEKLLQLHENLLSYPMLTIYLEQALLSKNLDTVSLIVSNAADLSQFLDRELITLTIESGNADIMKLIIDKGKLSYCDHSFLHNLLPDDNKGNNQTFLSILYDTYQAELINASPGNLNALLSILDNKHTLMVTTKANTIFNTYTNEQNILNTLCQHPEAKLLYACQTKNIDMLRKSLNKINSFSRNLMQKCLYGISRDGDPTLQSQALQIILTEVDNVLFAVSADWLTTLLTTNNPLAKTLIANIDYQTKTVENKRDMSNLLTKLTANEHLENNQLLDKLINKWQSTLYSTQPKFISIAYPGNQLNNSPTPSSSTESTPGPKTPSPK